MTVYRLCYYARNANVVDIRDNNDNFVCTISAVVTKEDQLMVQVPRNAKKLYKQIGAAINKRAFDVSSLIPGQRTLIEVEEHKDFIAIFLIMGGSSHARGPDKTDCCKRLSRSIRKDWGHLFKIEKGRKVTLSVYEVTGLGDLAWGDDGLFSDGKKVPWPKKENVEVTLT